MLRENTHQLIIQSPVKIFGKNERVKGSQFLKNSLSFKREQKEVLYWSSCSKNSHRKCHSENEGDFVGEGDRLSAPARLVRWSGGCCPSWRKLLFSWQFGYCRPLHPILEVVSSEEEFRGSGLVFQYQRTGELALSSEQKTFTALHSTFSSKQAEPRAYQPFLKDLLW